jgi:hypothetical protein
MTSPIKKITVLYFLFISLSFLVIGIGVKLFFQKKTQPAPAQPIRTTVQSFAPLYYPELENYTFKRQKNMPFRCESSYMIIDQTMKKFPKSNLVFMSNSIANSELLKLSATEPYYSFPTEEMFSIEFSPEGHSLDSVKKDIEAIIFGLTTSGFHEDNLNRVDESRSFGPRIVISKDDFSYIFSYSDRDISLSCIYFSPQQSIAVEALREISSIQHFKSDVLLSVWEAKDGLILINVSSINSIGGFAEYWGKVNGAWKILYSGQAMPWCDELEKYKVGLGMNCYRRESDGSGTNNVVKY